MKPQQKVAVIGAGLAGLTAAYRLLQNNIHVDVYEARNRVGGRVLTAFMKNDLDKFSIVELGAQNITDGGEAINFSRLAADLDLHIETKEINLLARVYYQGQYIDFQDRLKAYLGSHPTLFQEIDTMAAQCHSIGDLIRHFFLKDPLLQSAIATKMTAYEGPDANNQSLHHNVETFKCILRGGLSPSHESYEHQKNHILMKTLSGGNAQLPLRLAERLGSRLHLNKVLSKIEKRGHAFSLNFKDKSHVKYDEVILAVPASTYKNITLSDEIIDQTRWQKMQSVCYGLQFKVLFPLSLTSKVTVRSIISETALSFFNVDQQIITLFANQSIGNVREAINIINQGYQIQRQNLTQPLLIAEDEQYRTYTDCLHYSWNDNPYSLGSYSGYSTSLGAELDRKIQYSQEPVKTLFKPTDQGLYFIGEHTTILDYVGTMEAAVESGERIARMILTKCRGRLFA